MPDQANPQPMQGVSSGGAALEAPRGAAAAGGGLNSGWDEDGEGEHFSTCSNLEEEYGERVNNGMVGWSSARTQGSRGGNMPSSESSFEFYPPTGTNRDTHRSSVSSGSANIFAGSARGAPSPRMPR